MTPTAEPRLLASDEEALERAARALRRGTGFVIIVCAPALVPAARGCLEAKVGALRPTVMLRTGEEMLDALVEIARAQGGGVVCSLAVPGDARAAMVALNLHREKLLQGAPVVLWLEDAGALRALREVAPDAHAFRTAVSVVHGAGPFRRRAACDPQEVVQWRTRLKRARTPLDRAREGNGLAGALLGTGKLVEAGELVQGLLDGLQVARSDEEREARVLLLQRLAATFRARGFVSQARSTLHRALEEADFLPLTRGMPLRTLLLAGMPGPFGVDLDASREALSLARRWGLAPDVLLTALRAVAGGRRILGDLPGAREALNESKSHFHLLDSTGKASVFYDLAGVELASGDFSAAEKHLRSGADLWPAGDGTLMLRDSLALECFFLRAELAAAERLLHDFEATEVSAEMHRIHRLRLYLPRGELEAAFLMTWSAIQEALLHRADERHTRSCEILAEVATEAHEVGRLLPDELDRVMADLETAERESLAITGPEPPPWYPILFRLLRARIGRLDHARFPGAVDLAREALALARTSYPDLVPRSGAQLADNLLASGHPDEALSVLREVEPEAVSRGMLQDLANIRAAQIRALVHKDAPAEDIDERTSALCQVLASTGSPRITAETLLALARALPPACARPDVLSLAEEVQVAFFEMPMPAEEALAIEVAGDALLARGQPEEANRRFAAARARLERRGLGLRIPLLERKLAGAS